ncbi:MAG TPA: hypothetical protein VF786_13770 [Terriglobales bacterium]
MPSAVNKTVRSKVRASIMKMRTGKLGREADVTASVAFMATGYIKPGRFVSDRIADAQNGGRDMAELIQRLCCLP